MGPVGLFGLGANPVLISPAVRFAGQAPAFMVGTAIAALTLIPTITIAVIERRRTATPPAGVSACSEEGAAQVREVIGGHG